MNFKDWLISEISENTILYHRSEEELVPGSTLDPVAKHKDKHWLKELYTEQKIEEFRKEFAPDKPSRFNCVYCSAVPRSIFVTKGFLYEVKPIGKTHVTMAYYINEINNIFHNHVSYSYMSDVLGPLFKNKDSVNKFKWNENKDQLIDLISKYWGVEKPTVWENISSEILKKDPKWIEVLCEKVLVVRKASEEEKYDIFRKGDKIEFTENIKNDFSGKNPITGESLMLSDMEKIKKDFNAESGRFGTVLNIKKGTKGKIIGVRYNERPPKGQKYSPYDNMYSKNFYRYISVQIDDYNFYITLDYIDHPNMNKIIKKYN